METPMNANTSNGLNPDQLIERSLQLPLKVHSALIDLAYEQEKSPNQLIREIIESALQSASTPD